jgi:hypothetical protein
LPLEGPVEADRFHFGLSIAELRKLVGSLGTDTVIFTPGFFQDGAGQSFTPRESAATAKQNQFSFFFDIFSPIE